jgi:hypothetical protein
LVLASTVSDAESREDSSYFCVSLLVFIPSYCCKLSKRRGFQKWELPGASQGILN